MPVTVNDTLSPESFRAGPASGGTSRRDGTFGADPFWGCGVSFCSAPDRDFRALCIIARSVVIQYKLIQYDNQNRMRKEYGL